MKNGALPQTVDGATPMRVLHERPSGEARGFGSCALSAFVVLLALWLGGCKKIPEGSQSVRDVVIDGLPSYTQSEIEDGLSTHASPLFLGVFSGVYEYQSFDESALTKDLERIERLLRRRGFYEAKVRAARVVRVEENAVRVEIVVDPGERVHIAQITTSGLAALPFEAAEKATRAISLRSGEAFDEDDYEKAQLDVANALADVGYAFVRVNGKARVDLEAHRATVDLAVTPGPRARFGPITIEGLSEVPEEPVRSTLLLHEGEFYSQKELESARTALFNLGVFAQVDVLPDTSRPDSDVVPVVIRVQEAPLRNVGAGLGGKLDVQRLAATGRVTWSNRNFLGGLRKLTVSTQPGLTFFPTRVDNIVAPTRVLPENALTVRLEQPSFLEGRTLGFVETGYNVYPLLYPLAVGADPNLERIIGYNEITAQVGVSRSFWGRRVPVTLSMNWRSNFPFTYQGSLTDVPGLEPVIVAYPELLTGLDLRDDPISPTKGIFLSNSFQVAGPFLGGVLTDVRFRPEARAFYPLDNAKKVVLAVRVTFGMVFPSDYGDALTGGPVTDPRDPAVVSDQHKLLFRAFYSGGPDSNRGYPYQRIGPQGPIGFLLPPGENCSEQSEPTTCLRPLGGFSLWEASIEIRYRFAGPWSFVWFVDSSDVNAGVASFDFRAPHISTGPGWRYASPIGPLRLDLGWRVPGLQQFSPQPNEPPDISQVPPYYDATTGKHENWLEAFALSILIGEAF